MPVELSTGVSLKNILCATDFCESSQAALAVAADYARRHGSQLWVAHVMPPQPRRGIPMEPLPKTLGAEWAAAEQRIYALSCSALLADIPHQVELQRGELWPVIADILPRHDIDLIVAGSHGRGGVSKLLVGSVAEEITRLAPCPVLVVGPHCTARGVPQERLRHILYATDFDPGSLHAFDYALWLAEQNHAQLSLLHVIEMPESLELDRAQPERARFMTKLAELVPPDAQLSSTADVLVEFGDPAAVMLQVAVEKQSDLIVMGARRTQHPQASTHLAQAMTHRVLVQAMCPVLTVRG